jgi:hypothetical protein
MCHSRWPDLSTGLSRRKTYGRKNAKIFSGRERRHPPSQGYGGQEDRQEWQRTESQRTDKLQKKV